MDRLIDEYMQRLKTRILKMVMLVEEQVNAVIQAINEENSDIAKMVIEKDDKVDKYDIKIDKICQKIFALTQPVAMDLRMIMSAMTINTNLERIGDGAVNIAESFLSVKKKTSFFERTKLSEMFDVVKQMIKDSIAAYTDGSSVVAKKVIQTDDMLDKLHSDNHDILIRIMKESQDNIEPAVALLTISRQLERIGDHCTNIAEDVFFILEANMVKHNYEKYIFGDEEDDEL